MRLLNIETMRLEEFFDDNIPPYAILSHRWGRDEVSYQDFLSGRTRESDGYRKICEFCALVKERKVMCPVTATRSIVPIPSGGPPIALQWAWIDTCCIDKTSSAELSEAINSMYHWYSEAEECIVYMADVHSMAARLSDLTWRMFERSEWFDRGWTLQELLARSVKVFCTSKWEILGHVHDFREFKVWRKHSPRHRPVRYRFQDRRSTDLSDFEKYCKTEITPLVSEVTGIQQRYLEGVDPVSEASIACRMSWASQRRTTRSEDTAYCLLGLFDVNMPLLYGEGGKAFYRLQEEIIRQSADQSIFAWSNSESGPYFDSLQAPDVARFSSSRHIRRSEARPDFPYSITNIGLHLKITLQQPSVDLQDPLCLLHFTRLNCVSEQSNRPMRYFLLQCLHDPRKQWTRSRANDLFMLGIINEELHVESTEEQNEAQLYKPTHTEVFALLRHSGFRCVLCSEFDQRFCHYLIVTADRQAMLDNKALASWIAYPSEVANFLEADRLLSREKDYSQLEEIRSNDQDMR